MSGIQLGSAVRLNCALLLDIKSKMDEVMLRHKRLYDLLFMSRVNSLNVLSKNVMVSTSSLVCRVVVEFNISSKDGKSKNSQICLYSSTLIQISRWIKFTVESDDLKQ